MRIVSGIYQGKVFTLTDEKIVFSALCESLYKAENIVLKLVSLF